ncbi:MAG: response regulator transcription factor [Candidatus Obscuribacterales bacterium]|nr:response regulator transcription factor [Steroidobacteraceae bacterium]
MRLLVIEDEPSTAELVCEGLREVGYEVEHAADGRSGLQQALSGEQRRWDLIICDRTLPGVDGLTIVQTLRQRGDNTPILLLSALGDVDDRVTGLKAGGDDYLSKPYAFAELLARIEVLLRRGARTEAATHMQVGDLAVDLVARQVSRASQHIELTTREFELLVFLMRHANQIVTRKSLLEHVWGMNFDPQTNVVDVHMSRLRQAVDRGFERSIIHTVRGVGYQLGV